MISKWDDFLSSYLTLKMHNNNSIFGQENVFIQRSINHTKFADWHNPFQTSFYQLCFSWANLHTMETQAWLWNTRPQAQPCLNKIQSCSGHDAKSNKKLKTTKWKYKKQKRKHKSSRNQSVNEEYVKLLPTTQNTITFSAAFLILDLVQNNKIRTS